MLFYYKQRFYKQRQGELARNQANAKQHLEGQSYSHSSSTLSFKNNGTYSKK